MNDPTDESASLPVTRRLTMTSAIIEAIAAEMRRDERVFCIGQDIGPFGGSMQGARGLYEEFGPRRILEAPISESAMVGAAIGAALFGRRPIVEISFGEFLPAAMNQLINQAPNLHYMTGGTARVPVVVRTRVGDGPYGGHPQDYSAWFAHVPGLKVVMPATPADGKGLMIAAIRDDNPVLFFEPMSLAHGPRGEVPVGDHAEPFGVARTARAGRDVTVVTLGSTVPMALRAAATLASEGIDVEVIDLRTLRPWDQEAVIASVRRTGRLVTAHEAWVSGGFGAEVVATVVEHAVGSLLAPVRRVGAAPVPIPSGPLRPLVLPSAERIAAAIRAVIAGKGSMSNPESPATYNGVAIARSIPLRGLQRTVAQRLVESRQTMAAVTAMAEVDATALLACLERLRARYGSLSLTHLLIAATARCLRRHPRLNAALDGDTIHELAEINLSIALALPSDDLVAVTIRQADQKDVHTIAGELRALSERATQGRLALADVRGGTFTLSNYGMLRSVVWATPIITPGQTGVLGIGRIKSTMTPDDSDKGWTARPILPIALTYDHRILNGVPAGRFLDDLADTLGTEEWLAESTEGTPV